jgi:acetyl-CoA acyltransferase
MATQTPVIVQAVRTAQGKEGGALSEFRSEDLSIPLVEYMMEETGLEAGHVDDLMWGCAQQREEQATNIARQIAIFALDEQVPGTTVDRQCASSAQALISASDAIAAGRRDVMFAGGVESMSRVEMGGGDTSMYPKMHERYGAENLPMGATAEKVAERHDISREEQDEYGARSQQRAVEATEEGRFDDEIVPLETEDGIHDTDEGLRPGTTKEKLADLPTVFKEDGTVTPGTASQIADGAAGLLLTSRSFAEDHGLDVMAEVGTNNVAGVDPTVMGGALEQPLDGRHHHRRLRAGRAERGVRLPDAPLPARTRHPGRHLQRQRRRHRHRSPTRLLGCPPSGDARPRDEPPRRRPRHRHGVRRIRPGCGPGTRRELNPLGHLLQYRAVGGGGSLTNSLSAS